ncbi:MAG: hypothetical protein QNJ73_16050 [Gammaproteobacteria bacterium]|nr:hypothetical protein [Gammaproteobacteria bacterium]
MIRIFSLAVLFLAYAVALPVYAGAHKGAGPVDPDKFAHRSGFKGHEDELGAAVAKAIREVSPSGDPSHDFSGRERDLGLAMESLIKALNNRQPYQHEPNDALIKSHLTTIQFAKDNEMMEQLVDHEVETQSPMLERVGKLIERTGNSDLAMLAMTERTACFYQLVREYERDGDSMRWRSPYWNVLEQTRRMGQNDYDEKWLHENYTIPLMRKQAAVMGMDAEISDWQEDGWVTMTLVPPKSVAASN